MNRDESEVVEAALHLPPEARAALAGALLESLEPAADPDAEQAWSEEIAKRLAQIDQGEVEMVPWAEARRRIVRAE